MNGLGRYYFFGRAGHNQSKLSTPRQTDKAEENRHWDESLPFDLGVVQYSSITIGEKYIYIHVYNTFIYDTYDT